MSIEPQQAQPDAAMLIARNLRMTAVTVLACLVIGYGLGTLMGIPYRPSTMTVKVNRDGITRRTESRFVSDAEYAESDAIRRQVTWFCCWAGLAAAQAAFLVTELRRPAEAPPPPAQSTP